MALAEGGKDLLKAPPSPLTPEQVLSEYPLHWHIWHHDTSSLEEELALKKHDKEKLDRRGRTPLHFAVTLGYADCTRALLRSGCDANAINGGGWNVFQEAVCAGEPEIVSLVLQYRDFQRGSQRLAGIPDLLDELQATPDFYAEMSWEFTSWVPFMSRMCPRDTYKIYKSGANVRVDTTLIGFEQNDWQRGNRSYVFTGTVNGGEFLEIDHDQKRYWVETLRIRENIHDVNLNEPSQDTVLSRMTSPVVGTMLDTDKIAFARHKTMWGWGGDKTEVHDGYNCMMYSASGVEVVTKTRVEHLASDDKKKAQDTNASFTASGLQTLLGIEEEEVLNPSEGQEQPELDIMSNNPYNMNLEEYFNPPMECDGKDIGKLKEMSTKRQKFKATLSMADDYPLSLQQQILPIIKLLAISNAHFAKLRDFIALHLPAGFPVKIDIPLFHVLNAKITFGNINAGQSAVTGVQRIYAVQDAEGGDNQVATCDQKSGYDDQTVRCKIESSCFDAPTGYMVVHTDEPAPPLRDEEDELLQMAIQQSLLEYQQADQESFLPDTRESDQNEDDDLQRAIRESMKDTASSDQTPAVEPQVSTTSYDIIGDDYDNIQLAMALSQQQKEEEERLKKLEEEELEKVLLMSLTEK